MTRTDEAIMGTTGVLFTGAGESCDAVLALYNGPDPSRCVWKGRTNDGGFVQTPDGAVEFSPGDWIVRDVSGSLHVLSSPLQHVRRNTGLLAMLIIAWQAGELSEGQMVEISGLDRILLRGLKDELVKRGIATANRIITARDREPQQPPEPAA